MQWLIDIIKAQINLPPVGSIILWSGIFDDIPDGWAACDGNNGTPDLRELVVRAAGLGLAKGDTGGADTHTHSLVNSHTHSIPAGVDIQAGVGFDDLTDFPTKKSETVMASSFPPWHALWYIMKL